MSAEASSATLILKFRRLFFGTWHRGFQVLPRSGYNDLLPDIHDPVTFPLIPEVSKITSEARYRFRPSRLKVPMRGRGVAIGNDTDSRVSLRN